MDVSANVPQVAPKTPGDKLEGIAFTFCKAGTLVLIFGRYSLPAIATLASVLFLLAFLKGKKDTRCFLRFPILLAVVWGLVAVVAWINLLQPSLLPWK